MLFLQISDIHFRAPQCLNPDTDPDRAIRTRMQRHLLERLANIGRVDAILVGGDIAYQASPDEYKFAKRWLLDLAAASGCSENRIFVVPGNHDVDRHAITQSMSTRNAQQIVATTAAEWRETALRAQLANEQTGEALFHGHAAYNEFAAPMNCQIYPERPYWKQDVELSADVQLRIYGLTSTLLSGQNGQNDRRNSLYVSPLQTALDPVPDVVNMTICHHPFDWLMDGDDVEDALNQRATLQLFGHKHRQRVNRDTDFIRWGAGAVNPSRNEAQYEPGYNLVRIRVVGGGLDRKLEVDTHQFTYQRMPEGFHPIRTAQGADVFQHVIPFPVDVVPSFGAAGHRASAPTDERVEVATTGTEEVVIDPEAAMGDKGTRGIVARFWDLDSSDQRELALELGLISEEEIALPEPERYGKALIRAKERGLIEILADRIAKLGGQ